MPRKGFSSYAAVHTRGGSTDADRRFFPLTTARESADVKGVHGQIDILNISGDMYFQFGFQESDDPENWPLGAMNTTTVIGTFSTTSEGVNASTGYDSVSLSKAFVRFGVVVRNNNAGVTRTEHAWVAARFDTRTC